MLNSPKKAFTLIELLLVLAIVVVMISIVVFVARPEQILQNTKQLQIENDKQSIQTAYTKYKVDNNGQALFGDNLIPGMLYKICKDNVEDCDIDKYEVSISSLKDNRLLKNIPEIPDNSDSRYTGYYLSETDGADVNILVNTEIQNTPENTPPGSCFAYQGKTYCVVEGGGGELWLDRNLGGDNAGGSETDAGAYGELYQFGRGKDGHEIRTSGVSAGPSGSTSPGSNYLSIGGSPYNWYNGASGDSLWQGESGINNPCPNTWRLPSEEEWSDEISSWSSQNSAGGYGSSLKLVKGGRRDNSGSVQEAGSAGYYWSYSVENGTDKAKRVRIDNGSVVWNVGDERVEGMAVRCIKDKNAVGEQNNPGNYTLTEDGLGRCTGTLNINGSYRQGMGLTGAETVELSVFVASVGSYTISTDIINGYSFSKTGTFNSTGNTTVVLTNDGGIPENPGTDGFLVSGSNTDCTFEINVSEGTFYCPENYVRVPGNSVYGVSNYCLMKYEAKNVGGVPTSQAAGLPWTNVSQTDAISECSSLGTGYQLVTNEQWMTMARNMEQVSTNWNGGTVSSYLYYGHSDSNPNNALAASTLDTDTYSGTGNSTPSGQKRTLSLSNTEVIWDIAGNVAEWINGSITCAGVACTSAEMPYDSTPSAEWVEFTSVATYGELSYKLLRPLSYLLNSANGMGKLYTDNDAANPSGNSHALIRGGGWDYAANSGIYSLRLDYSPAYTASNLGFRCASSALVNPVCGSIAVPNTPSGPNDLYHATSGHVYIVNSIPNVDIYEWVYSGTGATITSGAQTNSITVSYANGATSGSWKVRAINSDTPINCEPQFESEYSSNLAVTITIPPTTVVANTATATYSVSSQNVTLNASLTNLVGAVNAGTVTFQLKNSGGTNVGTAVTSGTVTNGTVSVTYSIPAGTSSGAYNVHATYNPSGIFGAGSDTDSFLELTINTLNPTLSVSNTSKTFGDIAFTIAYSEDSDGTVTFTSSNTGVATITNAGLVSIAGAGTSTITLSTSATTNFNAGSTTATLSVNKANQAALTITTTTGTYGSTLTLTTSGGSGTGEVTYAVTAAETAGCSVAGNVLSNTAAGTCTVTATKAADTNYNAVSSSATTITIGKANQAALTITTKKGTYGSTLTLATSGGSGTGAVTYAVTAAGTASCSVSGSTLSFTSNGNCTVTATKATDTNYNAVSSSATTITIGNKPLSVSLSTPSKVYDGNTTATVTPTLVGGIVGSDVVTITTTGVSWAYDTATAGTGKTVTRTGSYALGGTNAGKYTLTQPSTTVTGSITKANQAALTLTPITAHMFNTSRVYTAGGGSGTGTYSDSLVSGSATRTAAFTYTANSATGTYVIRVTRATDANFNQLVQDFTINLSMNGGGLTWSPVAAAEANFWWSVAYGNGVWVAVAQNGNNRVMRSINNGASWSPVAAAEANEWVSVAYGNGVWVAVSKSGTNRVMRSTDDGVTWTSIVAAEQNLWYSVAYGNGVWMAVSYSGTNRVMRSINDGVTWTPVAATGVNTWRSVAYGNGVWVAVAENGPNHVMRSIDNGLTWTAVAAAEVNGWQSVAYGNGVWVAVASFGTNLVMRSTNDGASWSAIAAAEANGWYSVAYGNGVWVAVARTGTNRVMRSINGGANWTAVAAAEANLWQSVAYGNSVWMAVSYSGTNRVMLSTESLFCTDTDGGLNYSIKGTVDSSQCSNPQTDFCNGNVLQEQHCGPAAQCFTSAFSCTGGEVCIDGRCMPEFVL